MVIRLRCSGSSQGRPRRRTLESRARMLTASTAPHVIKPAPPPLPPPPALPSSELPAPSPPAPSATPQSSASVQLPIRLSTGVALPQTGPEGTLMSFSVDYHFDQGDPNPAGYSLVIERTQGAPARRSVRLAKQGELPILVPGWRPEDGPFHAHIEDLNGNRISQLIDLR